MKRWSTTPKFKQLVTRVKIPLIAVSILVLTPSLVFGNTQQFRDELSELDREISRNEQVVRDLQDKANTLQNRLAVINAEKNAIQLQIDKSEAEKEKLTLEIKENEEKMERQQAVLGDTLADLYVGASVTPIEMIASSDNITEYLDQAEYQSSIRDNLESSIVTIKKIKDELTEQKKEVETVIARQKAQRATLASKEREQNQVLAETRGQEASYKEMINDLEAKRAETEQALQRALASGSYKNNMASAGFVNAGQMIGKVGNTGYSFGAHLHLEVRVGGQVVSPYGYIQVEPVNPLYETQPYANSDCSTYPNRPNCEHPGADYGAGEGTPIRAVQGGELWRGWQGGYGCAALITHSDGSVAVYGHMTADSCN